MKVPAQAKKVFTGMIFDVYQWEQKLFDGSTATFEVLKRPDTTQVIATEGDKILVSNESQPTKIDFIGLFGGRLEPNETPDEGAGRELLEETGMTSDSWELLKVFSPVHKIDWDIHLFVARNCMKIKEPLLEPGEKIEITRVSFDDFLDIVVSERFFGREIAEEVLRMKLDTERLRAFKEKIFPS